MAATSADPLERLEAALALESSAPSRRMLIIVNPYATTVSDRLKNLVVYALRGRYQVDAIDTASRDHATELSREAAREGYDVVVAYGLTMISMRRLGALVPSAIAASRRSSGSADVADMRTVQHRPKRIVTR